MSRKSVVSDLKASSERVGRLYPILVDRHRKVIDGLHRLAADEEWPKRKLENVETEEQRLVARLISNACRRHVSAKRKLGCWPRLGEIYLKEGVEPGEIAHKIAEKTGMSYRWVMKYLAAGYKQPYVRKATQSARHAKDPKRRVISIELEEPPKGAIAVKTYGNTNFMNVMLDRKFYKQLEKTAKRLEITPDKLIYNTMLLLKNFSQ